MNETTEEAAKREVFEETGVAYEIDHLAFVHENFFDGDGSLEDYKCHELALYYLMKPRGTQELYSNSYKKGMKEEMHWFPIEELKKYRAYPSFLIDNIHKLKEGIIHIVTDERMQ